MIASAALAIGISTPCLAGELTHPYELRLGAALHDPMSRERNTTDATALVVLPRLSSMALAPRPMIGGNLNTAGRTSFLHAGLLWQLPISERFFVEIGLGGAIHNGSVEQSRHRSAMGCSAAFRESIGLGYRIDARWSVVTTLEHLSNGGLCRRNRGLTNLGASLGYSF